MAKKKTSSSFWGAVDAADKAISRAVFYLELGKLEWLVAFFGVWHGVPVTALGFPVPQIATWIVNGSATWGAVAVFIPFVVLAYKYVGLILRGDIMPFYSVKYLFPVMVCAMTASKYFGGDKGYAVHIFYLCSYFLTQMIVLLGKIFGRRMRPGSCLESELKSIHRELKPLQYVGKTGHTVTESFPSGDAAGAMCLGASAYVATGYQHPWMFVFGLLSAFGRMYFFAHHFGGKDFSFIIRPSFVTNFSRRIRWHLRLHCVDVFPRPRFRLELFSHPSFRNRFFGVCGLLQTRFKA